MKKVIEKCILPIFKDYNLDVNDQLKLLDLVKENKNKQYNVDNLRKFLQKKFAKKYKNNIKFALKEIDYVFSGISSRKLVALENKQKREERKRIKTK